MCGVDFSVVTGYSTMPIWDLPKPKKKEGEIVPLCFSMYNAIVLQPLCNVRNSVMASDSSSAGKRTISYLCATAMVLSGLLVGTVETVIRLALTIILLPMALGMFCSDHMFFELPLFFLMGTVLSGVAIYSGARAATECFTKNGDIESFRADLD